MTETPDMVPVSVPEVRTAHRVIQTPIPPKETVAALTALARIESRSMQGELPILWDSAEGSSIFDASGNQWIDFTSTIFVMNVGHANERVRGALMEVLERPLIHTYAYSHRLRIEYLERLIKFAGPPFEKAFLLSSGTEATEAGLKLMRMNGERLGKRRPVGPRSGRRHVLCVLRGLDFIARGVAQAAGAAAAVRPQHFVRLR